VDDIPSHYPLWLKVGMVVALVAIMAVAGAIVPPLVHQIPRSIIVPLYIAIMAFLIGYKIRHRSAAVKLKDLGDGSPAERGQ
jgi:hypothetical protein